MFSYASIALKGFIFFAFGFDFRCIPLFPCKCQAELHYLMVKKRKATPGKLVSHLSLIAWSSKLIIPLKGKWMLNGNKAQLLKEGINRKRFENRR